MNSTSCSASARENAAMSSPLHAQFASTAGAAGCVRMLELMEDEIRIALALLGVDRIGALDASYLHAAPPVVWPSITSAFPLIDGPDY